MAKQSFSLVHVVQPKVQIIFKGIMIYFIVRRVYMSCLSLPLCLRVFYSLLNENYVTFNRKVFLP